MNPSNMHGSGLYHVFCRSSANGNSVEEASSAHGARVIGSMGSRNQSLASVIKRLRALDQIIVLLGHEKKLILKKDGLEKS
jgi:hypothetical protein